MLFRAVVFGLSKILHSILQYSTVFYSNQTKRVMKILNLMISYSQYIENECEVLEPSTYALWVGILSALAVVMFQRFRIFKWGTRRLSKSLIKPNIFCDKFLGESIFLGIDFFRYLCGLQIWCVFWERSLGASQLKRSEIWVVLRWACSFQSYQLGRCRYRLRWCNDF